MMSWRCSSVSWLNANRDDALLIGLHEAIDAAAEEADALAAVEHKATADQALPRASARWSSSKR